MAFPKALIIGVIVLAVIGIVGLLFFTGALQEKPAAAKLQIDKGTVEVKTDSAYRTAANNMELKQGYSVRTLADSQATIIFLDSSVMRLDQNTEITLTRIDTAQNTSSITVTQSSGNTWNRVVRLSGISDYEVQTPTAVATVRGTAFSVDVAAESTISVVKGKVGVAPKGNRAAEVVIQNQTAKAVADKVDVEALQENRWIKDNLEKDEIFIAKKIQRLKEKYSFLVSVAKSTYGVTDEQIDKYLAQYLRGDLTIQQAVDQGILPADALPYLPEELKR